MKKWLVRQSVVHVRVYLWHSAAHSLLRHTFIHSFTCRHSAQCHGDARGPQVHDVSDTCSCVPRALGVRVSVCGCGDTFSAQGE